MRHLISTKLVALSAAVACLSILSGCYHRHRDPVYVEHVDVRVDEHHHDDHYRR